MPPRVLISVIDDDESLRESLPDLLSVFGFAAVPFESAEAFLAFGPTPAPQCLILDVSMPAMSGPELQQELRRRGLNIPIIFITAQVDPDLRSTLMAQGAVECLFKPFSEHELRSALDQALASV